MQEVTSVLTVSITTINKASEAEIEGFMENMSNQESIRAFEKDMKDVLQVDDVKLENVQHFVMDK